MELEQPSTNDAVNVQNCAENAQTDERIDVQVHRIAVQRAYEQILYAEGRIPTQEEVASVTGLHRNTVSKYAARSLEAAVDPARAFTDTVLTAIIKSAAGGDNKNAKLYMQLVHGFAEKRAHTISTDPRELSDSAIEAEIASATSQFLNDRPDFLDAFLDAHPEYLERYLSRHTPAT